MMNNRKREERCARGLRKLHGLCNSLAYSRNIMPSAVQPRMFLRLAKTPGHAVFWASNAAIIFHLHYFSTNFSHISSKEAHFKAKYKEQEIEMQALLEEEEHIRAELACLKLKSPSFSSSDQEKPKMESLYLHRKDNLHSVQTSFDREHRASQYVQQRHTMCKAFHGKTEFESLFKYRGIQWSNLNENYMPPSELDLEKLHTDRLRGKIVGLAHALSFKAMLEEIQSTSGELKEASEQTTSLTLNNANYEVARGYLNYDKSDTTRFVRSTLYAASHRWLKESIESCLSIKLIVDRFTENHSTVSSSHFVLNLARCMLYDQEPESLLVSMEYLKSRLHQFKLGRYSEVVDLFLSQNDFKTEIHGAKNQKLDSTTREIEKHKQNLSKIPKQSKKKPLLSLIPTTIYDKNEDTRKLIAFATDSQDSLTHPPASTPTSIRLDDFHGFIETALNQNDFDLVFNLLAKLVLNSVIKNETVHIVINEAIPENLFLVAYMPLQDVLKLVLSERLKTIVSRCIDIDDRYEKIFGPKIRDFLSENTDMKSPNKALEPFALVSKESCKPDLFQREIFESPTISLNSQAVKAVSCWVA